MADVLKSVSEHLQAEMDKKKKPDSDGSGAAMGKHVPLPADVLSEQDQLPPGWEAKVEKVSGKKFYDNKQLGVRQWKVPVAVDGVEDASANIGMHVSVLGTVVSVKSLSSGGSAERAGVIKVGDVLREVDGQMLRSDITHDQIRKLLRGPTGSMVKLKFRENPTRTEKGKYSVKVVREKKATEKKDQPMADVLKSVSEKLQGEMDKKKKPDSDGSGAAMGIYVPLPADVLSEQSWEAKVGKAIGGKSGLAKKKVKKKENFILDKYLTDLMGVAEKLQTIHNGAQKLVKEQSAEAVEKWLASSVVEHSSCYSKRVNDLGVSGDHGLLSPVTGVMQAPSMSLTEAATATHLTHIHASAYMAREIGIERSSHDPYGLTADEAGALTLYTMESELYPTLNKLLRESNRGLLKPFFPYLRLLLTARDKLPRFAGIVWRGVVGVDLRDHFAKGREMYWWSFTSVTKEVSKLKDPKFLGTSGLRTQFLIEVVHGVDIEPYSIYPEAEVLLYPGTKLQVVDVTDLGHQLFQVHLREIVVPVNLCG